MNRVTAVVDTNVFLHYQPFEQIDWREVLGAEEIQLVIPSVVVGELDRHKDGQNTSKRSRERARKTLVRFRELWAHALLGELSTGVSLRAETHEPTIDFAVHGLTRDRQDDRLIASLLEIRERIPDERVVLVTRDVGPELKARRHGVETIRLPERLELPDEPDPAEKRLRELEREIAELRNASPQVRLRFLDEDNRTTLVVPPPITADPEEVAQRMRTLRGEYPRAGVRRPSVPPPQGSLARLLEENLEAKAMHEALLYPQSEIERYNHELDKFFESYESYLLAEVAHAQAVRLAFPLEIQLLNEGTAPAEDLDVFLYFPDGFRVLPDTRLPEAPKPPRPPRRMQSMLQVGLGSSAFLSRHSDLYMPRLPDIEPPANVSSPTIRRTGVGYEVTVSVRRLKHGLSAEFDLLYVLFASDDTARQFGIEYRINAANLRREASGRLHVVVKREE